MGSLATNNRRRVLFLLAVYALFLVMPGVHLLGHQHGAEPAALLADGPPALAPACGGDCSHPFHEHDDHLHGACAICKVLASWKSSLPDPIRIAHVAAPNARIVGKDPTHRLSPELPEPSARAPPAVLTTVRFPSHA